MSFVAILWISPPEIHIPETPSLIPFDPSISDFHWITHDHNKYCHAVIHEWFGNYEGGSNIYLYFSDF